MTLKYESELLFDLMKRDGDDNPSSVLPYESELKEKYLNQVVGAYPKLQDYRPEWLNYNLYHHLPSDFPVESVTNVTSASFNNVVPYAYKSASLKGVTYNNVCIDCHLKTKVGSSTSTLAKYNLTMIDKSKNYDVYFDITDSVDDNVGIKITIQNWSNGLHVKNTNGRKKVTIDSSRIGNDFNGIAFYFVSDDYNNGARANVSNIVVVESNNCNLSYFEGMQSVKMPVLTTIGKNLFDYQDFKNKVLSGGGTTKYPINLKPNTTYTFSDETGQWNGCGFFLDVKDENNNIVAQIINSNLANRKSFTFSTNSSKLFYLFIHKNAMGKMDSRSSNFQIEKGATATPYEAFKSNILTVNEEVELRGIGDVKDTLDLTTGELTQRIGEMIVDDSNDWWIAPNADGSLRTGKIFSEIKIYSKLSCDLLPTIVFNDVGGQKGVAIYEQQIIIYTEHTNEEELKRWVQQNPLTIQYELATESIKTVDLSCINEQGESETFRPIEGTMHVSTSSQTLPPLLDMSVPVEATSQNLMSFANIVEEE